MNPLVQMKIGPLLAEEREKTSNFPIGPLSVHSIRRALQAYDGLGKNACFGTEFVIQNTDIDPAECLLALDTLTDNKFLEQVDSDAYRLTSKGVLCARRVEEIFLEALGSDAAESSSSEEKGETDTQHPDIWKIIKIGFWVALVIAILIKLLRN